MPMPPVQFLPAFVADPAALLGWLQKEAMWDERMRSRRTASFGVAYDYSQIAYPDTAMPPQLGSLCTAIERELGFCPNNCLVNDYPDGNSKMGYHSDQLDRMAPETGVAILSLGATRVMAFRLKRDHQARHELPLPAGSLLYMPAGMQADWQHAIPPMPDAGARISLSFRALV
jgi:alkylated DNA repair dioxygenase AlkB